MSSISRVFMSLYMRGNLVKGGTPLFSSDGLKSLAIIEITCVCNIMMTNFLNRNRDGQAIVSFLSKDE